MSEPAEPTVKVNFIHEQINAEIAIVAVPTARYIIA